MKFSDLRPAPGAKKIRKRVGRGPGSGLGKTSGRGHKGAGQRSGVKKKRHHEGGQNPIARRLPKQGFTPFGYRLTEYQEVNLVQLSRFEANTVVDREALFNSKAIANKHLPVKILGNGAIDVALTLKVEKISEGARKKIEAAGGKVEIVETRSQPQAASSES